MQVFELEKLVNEFREKNKRYPTSLTEVIGVEEKEIKDPYDGHYYFDSKEKKVKGTSKVDRYNLFEKKEDKNEQSKTSN